MKTRESQTFLSLYYEPGAVQTATGKVNPFTRKEPMRAGRGDAKSLGQVFTPPEIAEILARWVVSRSPRTVLDPAAGLGHLLYQCWRIHPNARYVGIECDLHTFKQAAYCAPVGTKLIRADYLKSDGGQFEAIIANPPYVKAHHLDYTESDWRYFEERFGTRLDRLTNLYGLFLLKIWEDLAPGGRAAVIIPAEFLNANFGTELKERLLRGIRPAGIAIFDPARNVFDQALTTSCIMFLEKGRSALAPIHSLKADGAMDVRHFQDDLLAEASGHQARNRYLNLASHKPEEKWLNQILEPPGDSTQNLPQTVGDYFRCLRGIATGANDYFCLTRGEMAALGLKRSQFKACITKASDAKGLIFTRQDFQDLVARDRRCFLLNPNEIDEALERYLKLGEGRGIPTRYLPSHRPVWYLPENRKPADIWVAVFSRESVKFILNEAAARNLTCFHGLYSKTASRSHVAAVVLFLNSSEGRRSFFTVNRFYGDGLNKLEPKDVEAMPCPKLPDLNDHEVDGLLRKLDALDNQPNNRRQNEIDRLAAQLFSVKG